MDELESEDESEDDGEEDKSDASAGNEDGPAEDEETLPHEEEGADLPKS